MITKKQIESAQKVLLKAGYKIVVPAYNTNADRRPITEIILYQIPNGEMEGK